MLMLSRQDNQRVVFPDLGVSDGAHKRIFAVSGLAASGSERAATGVAVDHEAGVDCSFFKPLQPAACAEETAACAEEPGQASVFEGLSVVIHPIAATSLPMGCHANSSVISVAASAKTTQ